MAFGKRPANDKVRSTGSSKCANEAAKVKEGCPIPLQSGCLKGLPLPGSMEEGVKMECSNVVCPFKDDLMHKECFEALENNLIKIMSTMGSARGWTNAQRRANLWDKKGLSLIQKLCRCTCGMGVLRLDQSAMFLMEREAAAVAPVSVKTKKSKGKKLPKLNFNGPSTAALVDDKSHEKTEKKMQQTSRCRSTSLGNQSATTFTPVRVSERPSGCNRKPTTTTNKAGWVRHFSAATIPTLFSPRRSSGPITYAEAALRAVTYIGIANENDKFTESGSSRRTSDASEAKSFTGSCASSSPSDDSMMAYFSSEFNVQQDQRSVPEKNGITVDMTSVLLSPPETPPICSENGEIVCESQSELSDGLATCCYDLFSGHSFYLGEKLVAESCLPGAIY
ncbi:unnamed protein product [Toxocara canis]|uniref:Headcase protein n=1 Tax=Toxocara canis TaxID=6265 RepID=A0A183V0C5_TOXCA|nr:unnamed protein product [Toxocara canis]